MYQHQDWDVVIFNKKKQSSNNNNAEGSVKRIHLETPVSLQKLSEDREDFHHKKIPKEVADAIRNKRLELNLTQTQLAQKINVRPQVIQEIESMKGIYDHIIINKLTRILGFSLKNIIKT
jgi:ribosome-binding protein aMBF1 (putative translation factor)